MDMESEHINTFLYHQGQILHKNEGECMSLRAATLPPPPPPPVVPLETASLLTFNEINH